MIDTLSDDLDERSAQWLRICGERLMRKRITCEPLQSYGKTNWPTDDLESASRLIRGKLLRISFKQNR